MYYDYLGNNQYRVYVAIYRDCASSGAPFDAPLLLGVFDGNDNQVMQVEVPFPGSNVLPIVFDNPCVTAPSGICTERAIYTTVLTLPPIPGGYTLAYQRCCRGPNVTNLNVPEDTGLTLTTYIPTSANNLYINSAPRFVNYPPLVICNNEDLNFDHSATDPDGDVLVYELVTPFAGANPNNPLPDPVPSPNYPFVSWESGFNANVPLGPGSVTTINPNTGQLFVDASALGLYVVGIRVKEYRNGIEINATTRDFLFRVVNCVIQLQANVTEQEDMPGFAGYCTGLSFTFDNQSFGGSSYEWNFGDPTTTTDVSTAFEPSYTYPQPGIYTAMLVVNPGWPCTDTALIELNLNNPLEIDFTFTDSICSIDNSVDFTSQVIGTPVSYEWDFGPNASPASATTPNVNNVHFTATGNIPITAIVEAGVCQDTMTHILYLHPEPIADFELPTNYECLGLTQSFDNTSTGATSYDWDFGDPNSITDVSTVTDPTFTFPSSGTYTITLIAESVPGCSDTLEQPFTVYDPLSVDFTHTDSLCITNNSFDFFGDVSGPSITTYSWNFGPNATPSTATTLNVSGVSYDSPGEFPVTLTASFLGCSESASSSVFVFREPEINFGLNLGLQCEPYYAYFIDSSSADSDISYLWDFGDGNTSTEQHPLHVYQVAGQYIVTLNITTTEGCAQTLSLSKDNLINVHETPEAGFMVDPQETNICDAFINFTDQSDGALTYWYFFDDEGTVASDDPNPGYNYTTPGTHNPMQIVTNEFFCKDTAIRTLYIEPFTVYIPNTFTPDEDEFNNTFKTVLALEPVEWEIRIYNRWGQLVYTSTDPAEEWDGTYNGLICPNGIYSYAVRYMSCGAGERWEELTGFVNLMR